MVWKIVKKMNSNTLKFSRFSIYSLMFLLSAKEKKSGIAGWVVTGSQIALRIGIYAGMYRVALGSKNDLFVNGIWAIAISQTIFGGERPQLSLQIGREIKDGTVSMYLLRPASYLNQTMFSYLGRSLPSQSAIATFGFTAAFFITGRVPIALVNLPLAILMILGGILLTELIEMFLGLTGFWTNDTTGVQLMNHKLDLLFGGIIIPFALLPETIANIVRFTPWSVSAAQPGYVATNFSYSLYIEMFAVLMAWLSVTYFASVFLYKRGIKNLTSGGG